MTNLYEELNTQFKSKRLAEILHGLNIDLTDIVVLSEAGSSMYGTRTPDSDEDYLGIYIPTLKQLLLNEPCRQISLPKDSGLDCQIWSLQYFIKLACQGETMAIDLLHAPDENILFKHHEIWDELVSKRKLFYTKSMKSYVHYARNQAMKYGIKGTRIEAMQKVIDFLECCPDEEGKNCSCTGNMKLKEVWDKLPTGKHIHFIDAKPWKLYQVGGKKFQETVKLSYVADNLRKTLQTYGKRAFDAQKNQGIDWKGLSHACRAANQVYDILTKGDYTYPLEDKTFITDVKRGRLNFSNVQPYLEKLMDDIEELIEKSNLPDKIDEKYWEKWMIMKLYENKFGFSDLRSMVKQTLK